MAKGVSHMTFLCVSIFSPCACVSFTGKLCWGDAYRSRTRYQSAGMFGVVFMYNHHTNISNNRHDMCLQFYPE